MRNIPEDGILLVTVVKISNLTKTNKFLSFKSASKLYRLSGRRLSVKLLLTSVGRGVLRGQSKGSPQPLFSDF
jgi:hypothetical protein